MKRVAVTLSVFAVLFFGATVLHAGKPIIFTQSGGGPLAIGYCADAEFEVWEDVTYEIKGKAFFNKEGDLVRVQWHWTLEGVVYNFDHPENFLPYKNSSYTQTLDPETGEQRFTGLYALVTVPGYGSIFMDMGLIVFDEVFNVVFEAGKHQWWNANVDGLCEHLTP